MSELRKERPFVEGGGDRRMEFVDNRIVDNEYGKRSRELVFINRDDEVQAVIKCGKRLIDDTKLDKYVEQMFARSFDYDEVVCLDDLIGHEFLVSFEVVNGGTRITRVEPIQPVDPAVQSVGSAAADGSPSDV